MDISGNVEDVRGKENCSSMGDIKIYRIISSVYIVQATFMNKMNG